MERFLPLVRHSAERIYARLPDEVDIQDLMSAGLFGLMDAIDAYDLDRGVKFEAYCAPRIRGAILDELRSMAWVPRLARHRTSRVEAGRKKFEKNLGLLSNENVIALTRNEQGGKPDTSWRPPDPISPSNLNNFDRLRGSDKGGTAIDAIAGESIHAAFDETQRQDVKELMSILARPERLLVILYHYEEMTMTDIATTLGVSESRVSQLHSSILLRLKAQMQHREAPPKASSGAT